MATSGSIDYTQDRDTLITSAFELIGVGVEGETLDSEDIAVGQRAMNIMLKAFLPLGLQMWKRTTSSIDPLVASQSSYSLGTGGDETFRPLRIISAHRVDSDGDRTEMLELSWQEYSDLSNLTTTGTPVNYHYNPGTALDTGTFYIWPTADSTAVSDYTISLTYRTLIEDMDATDDDLDMPVEWQETIIYNLARRLYPRYGINSNLSYTEIVMMARESLDLVTGWDNTSDGNICFEPAMSR